MLTLDQLQKNREEFIQLVKSITIKDFDCDGLLSYLDNSDFFFAPATGISHGNYDGGLCEHSLNVYRQLKRIVKGFASHVESVENTEKIISKYSDDTVKILGLFHDLSRINYYEKYIKNVKNEETGKWDQIEQYRIKEPEERNICGDLSLNSFLIISKYIPLSQEEVVVLMNFNCGMDNGYSNKDLHAIMKKYPLVVLLHCADMISSYVDYK